jgi:hypothetical protein
MRKIVLDYSLGDFALINSRNALLIDLCEVKSLPIEAELNARYSILLMKLVRLNNF